MVKRKKAKTSFLENVRKDFLQNKYAYLMVIPVVVFFVLFHYKPMYGIVIAFKNYRPIKGIENSDWVGLKWFKQFLMDPYYLRIVRNSFVINILQLCFVFPCPILFALLLNEVKVKWFKKTVQTISYMPHFISIVVICSLVTSFCQTNGVLNDIIEFFGGERRNLLQEVELYYPIYLISDIWQGLGWSAIIYLAALSGIDQEQYEAAKIDGAGRLQQMRYITFPGLMPTVTMLFILQFGSLLSVGRDKTLLLYNELTYEVADVISTYVYRRGLSQGDFSYSTAIGLFQSVINIVMLVTANKMSKKLGQSGLF